MRPLLAIIGMQIYLLIFDASPEPFHEYIITPATSSVHAYGNIFFLQKLSELPARELAALVGVEDLGCAIKSECLSINPLFAFVIGLIISFIWLIAENKSIKEKPSAF